MDEVVHVFAEEVFGVVVAEESEGGGVAEGALSFEVDAVDGFGGGVEDELEFGLAFVEGVLCA